MSLSVGDRSNFETLRQAILQGDAALMECQLVRNGAQAAVICAVNREPDASLSFVPLALLFSENPYTLLIPPHPDRPDSGTPAAV